MIEINAFRTRERLIYNDLVTEIRMHRSSSKTSYIFGVFFGIIVESVKNSDENIEYTDLGHLFKVVDLYNDPNTH